MYYFQLFIYFLLYLPFRLLIGGTKVEYQKNHIGSGKTFIIVLNHNAKIDPFLLFLLPLDVALKIAPVRFLTAEYYYNKPLIRLFIKPLGAYPLKKLAWTYKELFKESVEFLTRKDQNVLIFPEGKIVSLSDNINAKPGVGYLISESKRGILPIRIIGSESINFKDIVLRRKKLTIKVGKVISFEKEYLRRNTYKGISLKVMHIVYSL